jgi:hypothetical protein
MIRAMVLIFVALTAVPLQAGDRCTLMSKRLLANESLAESERDAFLRFFPLFCDYLERDLPPAAAGTVLDAASLLDFRTRLAASAGRDIFELGERMLQHYDRAAKAPDSSVPMKTFESEHFVFAFHGGSPAEADLALIAESSEEILRAIASTLDVGGNLEAARRIITTKVDAGGGSAPARYDGRIPVYLHAHRSGDAAARIPNYSYGIANLGATILHGGKAAVTGTPRLTSRIDVLYLNPFSLIVLHHEIAHAVMLLGSFDATALEGKTLSGKSELKKAFFAGYRKIPVFLHEAVGDYAFYYRGLHRVWPLMVGSPEQIIVSLQERKKYIPLAKLLKEDAKFRAANHKSYSLQAAAFIHFLSETRGAEPMRQWLLADDRDGARSFRKIFGMSLDMVEAEWLSWVAERAERMPPGPTSREHRVPEKSVLITMSPAAE